VRKFRQIVPRFSADRPTNKPLEFEALQKLALINSQSSIIGRICTEPGVDA
jgi:hypothetical protein